MEKKFLSIIVPVYNVENELMRFLTSLNKQTSSNFEVVFVNDGSTDKSEHILRNSKKSFSNIIINQTNMGSGVARNNGCQVAKGQYLLFADPDDSLEVQLVEFLELNSLFSSEVVMFGFFSHNKKGTKEVKNKFNIIYNSKDLIEKNFIHIENQNNFNSVWNKIYNREFYEQASVFFTSNKTAQDAIFNYNLLNNINCFQILREPLYNYFVDRPNSAQSNKKYKFIDEFVLMKKKMECFAEWSYNREYLQELAILDFFTTQVLNFKGAFPKYFISSEQYIQSMSLLKKISFKKKFGLVFNVKLFLLKKKQNKIIYFLYKFWL